MRRKYLLGILLALFALALRLHHIGWGLPDWFEEAVSVKRAWGFWGWGRDGYDFNPHFFIYPSFYFYLQFAAQAVVRAAGWFAGAFPDAETFRLAWHLNGDLFLLAGRTVTALFGSATVMLLFLTGWRIGGVRIAVPAALFFALHAVHLEKCRFVEVDVALTFFAALSYHFLVVYLEEGKPRDLLLASAAVGLAAAVKYPGALLLLNIFLAPAFRRERSFPRLVIAGSFLAGAVFLIASPYVLLDFDTFRNDFAGQVYHMREGHFGREAEGVWGAWRHFTAGSGVPLFLVSAVGAAWALARRRREMILVFFPAALFTLLSMSRMQDPHYPLPAAAPLALLAAAGLSRIVPARRRGRDLVLAGAVLLLLAPPCGRIADLHRRLSAPDTRTEARRWIEENLPPGTLILREPHGPQLASMLERDEYLNAPEYAPVRARLLAGLRSRPAYATAVLPSYDISWWRSARFYHFEPYQWFDTIVVSGSIRDRYRKDPERFPVQNRFYDELERRFRSVASFEPAGGLGPAIEVYRRSGGTIVPAAIALDRTGAGDEVYRQFMLKTGIRYERSGLHGPAAFLYRALIDLLPEETEAMIRLGTLLARTGSGAEGVELLERAVRLDRTDRTARRNLAVLLSRGGEIERGADLFEELLGEDERDGEMHLNYASSLLALGRTELAVEHFERFLALSPEHPKAEEIAGSLGELKRVIGEGEAPGPGEGGGETPRTGGPRR